MAPEVRVLIADGRPLVRMGARNALHTDASVNIVGEVENGDDAITQTLDLLPDILLLDLTMPRLPGLDAMRAIMKGSPQVKIVLLANAITPQQIVEALQLGACAILAPRDLPEHLGSAIRAARGGEYWLGDRQVPSLVKALHDMVEQASSPDARAFGLTRRELEVLACIVEGFTNREIARQYELSEETVKRHLSNIFDKVGVSTRLELALFAINHHLVA